MNIYYDVEDNHYRTYPDGDIASIDQMRELIENKNVSIVKLQQENQKYKEVIDKIRKEINEEYSIMGVEVVENWVLKDILKEVE